MSAQTNRGAPRDAQFDRFLEAVDPLQNARLFHEFNQTLKRLMPSPRETVPKSFPKPRVATSSGRIAGRKRQSLKLANGNGS